MVSGGVLTGIEMHGKAVSIVGAHFRSHWLKRSANTDRESLGKFGPAFVSDLSVAGHVQAGQARVHLQEVDRTGVLHACKLFGAGIDLFINISVAERRRTLPSI